MKAILIHNPSAGFKNHTREELTGILSQEGYEVNYVNAKKDDIGEALKNPGELVIVAGGDGTIAETAEYLVGRNIPLALMPMGTANNIAATLKELGLPGLQAANRNPDGYISDVGTVTDNGKESCFFESSGFGLFTKSIAESNKMGKNRNFKSLKEKIEFGLDVLKSILPVVPAVHYEVILDGKDYSGKYIMVEVMNIKSIGPNIALAPDASPGDGFFDIVLLTDVDRPLLAQYLDRLPDLNDARFEKKVYRASQISIRTGLTEFHIDDELTKVRGTGKMKFSLQAGFLKFAWVY